MTKSIQVIFYFVFLYVLVFIYIFFLLTVSARFQNSSQVTYIGYVELRRSSHHRFCIEKQKRLVVVRDKVHPTRNVIPIEIFG